MKITKTPFISVVLVNYNGRDILRECLPSYMNVNYPKNRFEVIIVDNASTDGSVDFIKKNFPLVKLVCNKKNEGYVGANEAISICKGEFIYLNNNDAAAHKNCLRKLVEPLIKDDSIGMTSHRAVNYYDRGISSGGTWLSRAMYGGHKPKGASTKKDMPKDIPFIGGGMIRKSIVDKFGYLLDKDYFIYAEDVDLGLRIRLIGKKVVFVDDAITYHMHSVTAQKVLGAQTTYLMERNLLMTFFKDLPLKLVLLYAPYVVLFRFTAMAKDILMLNFKRLKIRLSAFYWVISNFRLILKKRSETQKLMQADAKFISSIFSEKYLYKKKFLV